MCTTVKGIYCLPAGFGANAAAMHPLHVDFKLTKRYAYVLMATHDQAVQLMQALRGQGLVCELSKVCQIPISS